MTEIARLCMICFECIFYFNTTNISTYTVLHKLHLVYSWHWFSLYVSTINEFRTYLYIDLSKYMTFTYRVSKDSNLHRCIKHKYKSFEFSYIHVMISYTWIQHFWSYHTQPTFLYLFDQKITSYIFLLCHLWHFWIHHLYK
jgi:hypothetical protein